MLNRQYLSNQDQASNQADQQNAGQVCNHQYLRNQDQASNQADQQNAGQMCNKADQVTNQVSS
ncbi:MAG: hypothetical protein SGJ00_14425 [bacterium]|nr:hypothetical protein [bacterium]